MWTMHRCNTHFVVTCKIDEDQKCYEACVFKQILEDVHSKWIRPRRGLLYVSSLNASSLVPNILGLVPDKISLLG